MADLEISTKRFAISKANAQMVTVTAVAAFVTVFCLVASHALWSQDAYQNRVIKAQDAAHAQLQTNLQAVTQLVSQYENFVNTPTNVIGGSSTGTGHNSGDNATIVLDALPSDYDFPALTSSVESILNNLNLTISSINGTDDEVAQEANTGSNSPQAVPMAFTFSVTNANYTVVQQLITDLQLSIRPIQIDTLSLSGDSDKLTVAINAHTYYQPAIKLTTTTETVK